MKIIVIIILLIAAIFQDIKIKWLQDEVENIKLKINDYEL